MLVLWIISENGFITENDMSANVLTDSHPPTKW